MLELRRLGAATGSIAAALALGCAAGSGGRGGGPVYGANFPSEQELAQIESAPPPRTVFPSNLRSVGAWELEGPIPDRIEPRRWVPSSPWGKLLREVADASGGRAVPTEAMHCVARALARFSLEHGGQPDHEVRRFIVGACNASVSQVSYELLHGEVASTFDEDEIFERWRVKTLSMLRRQISSPGRAVGGVAFERRNGRAAVFAVIGHPEVELEPVATRLERGQRFELRGRALGPAESILAAVNRGRYGVEFCEPMGEVEPPRFHLACELEPGDDSAWVSLSIQPPNRVLGRSALHALVWQNGSSQRIYRRFEYAAPRRIASPEAMTPALVEELNGVRERAGMRPVTLDVGQSETAARVAPHLFAALAAEAPEEEKKVDTMILGLMAGWDVEGTIRDGGFAYAAVPQTDDVAVLLSAVLEEPMSRWALLDPEIERLAVGPLLAETEGIPILAAVTTGYAMFGEGPHDGDADLLFERLAAARHERELPPMYRLSKIWMNAMGAARDVGDGDEPDRALDDLLNDSVGALSSPVSAWYGETSELDEFEFPEEYLSARRIGVAIGVSHRKDPGDAWGRYVVVLVGVKH